MRSSSLTFRKYLLVASASLAALVLSTPLCAQSSSQNELKITPTAADAAAAASAKTTYRHAWPANTPAGRGLRAKETAQVHELGSGKDGNFGSRDGGIVSYPGDLTYFGGATLGSTVFHAIYLLPNGSCPIATCWGDPEGFLRDLSESNFVHLSDQYTGEFGRYRVGFHVKIPYVPPSVPLTDNDILGVVHAVAAATGDSGYGHLYHVFLPPGQDECFTSAFTTCYSPDVPASFFFCGYHSSADFSDIGHVVYSVEPYQNVGGCSIAPGSPNGQLIDSTDNVLNHETFEAISDPDGNAWINGSNLTNYGAEVGDECSFITFVGQNAFFNPPSFRVGDHKYAVQSIYSNDVHGCGTAP